VNFGPLAAEISWRVWGTPANFNVASKSGLKLAAPAILSADAGLLVPIVDMCLSCEDTARQICAMVPRWRI